MPIDQPKRAKPIPGNAARAPVGNGAAADVGAEPVAMTGHVRTADQNLRITEPPRPNQQIARLKQVITAGNRLAGSGDAGAHRKLTRIRPARRKALWTSRISARQPAQRRRRRLRNPLVTLPAKTTARQTCPSHRPVMHRPRSRARAAAIPTRIGAMTTSQPRDQLAQPTSRQKNQVNRVCHPHLKTGRSPAMKQVPAAVCPGRHPRVTHPVTVTRFGLPVRAAETLRRTKGRDAMTDKQRR